MHKKAHKRRVLIRSTQVLRVMIRNFGHEFLLSILCIISLGVLVRICMYLRILYLWKPTQMDVRRFLNLKCCFDFF